MSLFQSITPPHCCPSFAVRYIVALSPTYLETYVEVGRLGLVGDLTGIQNDHSSVVTFLVVWRRLQVPNVVVKKSESLKTFRIFISPPVSPERREARVFRKII